MRNLVVTAAMLLASCASAPPLATRSRVVLHGVPGNAKCHTTEPYSGEFSVLKLDKPIRFGSSRNVTQVELVMDETLFVQYGLFIGKPSIVTCHLWESRLCGYPQVSCEASDMEFGP